MIEIIKHGIIINKYLVLKGILNKNRHDPKMENIYIVDVKCSGIVDNILRITLCCFSATKPKIADK